MISKVISPYLRAVNLTFAEYPDEQDRIALQTLLMDDSMPFGSNAVKLRCVDDDLCDNDVGHKWGPLVDQLKGGFSLLDQEGRLEFVCGSDVDTSFSWGYNTEPNG